jgi:hypothetical protein
VAPDGRRRKHLVFCHRCYRRRLTSAVPVDLSVFGEEDIGHGDGLAWFVVAVAVA